MPPQRIFLNQIKVFHNFLKYIFKNIMNFFSIQAETHWRDELLPNEREYNSTLTSSDSKDRERKQTVGPRSILVGPRSVLNGPVSMKFNYNFIKFRRNYDCSNSFWSHGWYLPADNCLSVSCKKCFR